MNRFLAVIKDSFTYYRKSPYWLLITLLLILATVLSLAFIFQAKSEVESTFVNSITIITTALAFFLLFSDFHRNWRESREKRLTTLFYQKDSKGKPTAVMFYYRATLGGESDIRSLAQQLGVEIVGLGIGENQGHANTRLNLSVASNQYAQLSKILQDEKGKMIQDYIAISAIYDWTEEVCKGAPPPNREGKEDCLKKIKNLMQDALNEGKIYFAKGASDETEWGFSTWEEIATKIDPEIKAIIEVYGKENKLIQFPS